MKKFHRDKITKKIIAIVTGLLIISGLGLYVGTRYVNYRLLQSNENMAVDIALLIANNFQITDEEVSYMKSLSFNEMEEDAINRRLMNVQDGMVLTTPIRNIYLLTQLQGEEVRYYANGDVADFFGYEDGTQLNGMWLLNGTFDDDGKFVEQTREDIYRYTALTKEQEESIQKEKTFGEYSEDAWGNFVTGYAPMYTVEGKFVGLLGIDMEPDQFQESARRMMCVLIVSFVIAIIFMTILFLWFYLKYIRNMEREQEEKERKYTKQIEAMEDVDEENLIVKGRHNLTKNITELYCVHKDFATKLGEDGRYDTLIENLSKVAYKQEDAERILSFMNRERILQEFQEGRTEGNMEYQRRLPNGDYIWVLMRFATYEEPEGHDIFIFVYSYDISERMIEKQIVNKISAMDCDAIGLLNVKTHQYELKDLLGRLEGPEVVASGDFDIEVIKRLREIVVPNELEYVMKQFRVENIIEQLKVREVFSIVYSIKDDNNSIRRKRFRFCYLDDSKDLILYSRSDITDMYEREQEQLRQTEEALDMARRASEAKTEFFSRMSHDMRTPMNGILGLADLSQEENDITILKENINKIQSSGEYLLGLINDTLDFQKIESGKLNLEPEIVNTKELMSSITSMISNTAREKGITFRVLNKNANLDWLMRLDPMRIRQIFINLLSNAIKFTPAGGTVEGEVECLGREGMISHIVIHITDTGIGMSEEFLKNGIFKPFSQESNEVTSSYAGTGLGLSIAKQLIELMGGSISVKSEKGVGTKFTIHLDFERVTNEEAQKILRRDDKINSSVLQMLKKSKILLAEDHVLNAEIARRLLEKVKCQVTWVKNGQECIDVFEQSEVGTYDCILMDIRMPVMDGLKATKNIRKLNRMDAIHIPIIAMTANAYEEDVRKSMEAGMNAHLAKPIDVQQLYSTVAKEMEKAGKTE